MRSDGPFKKVSSKDIYKNPWIDVKEDTVIRPGGAEGIFGTVDVKDGVNVVVLTPDQTILMAKEFKYGHGDYTLECIGGGIDEGETPEETAKREVKEEAGVVAMQWTAMGHTISLPTMINFNEHLFLAEKTEVVDVQATDEGEVIEIVELPFREAVEKAISGELIQDTSVVAILRAHALLNR